MKVTKLAVLALAAGLAASYGCDPKTASTDATDAPETAIPAADSTPAAAQPAPQSIPIDTNAVDADGFKTRPSGLKIKYTKENPTGKLPASGDKVKVHYTGTLTQGGKKFDSSRDRNAPFEFVLGQGQVIAGWDEGIALLRTGERAILRVPSAMGYGPQGTPDGGIPPNASLDFDVEMLSFATPPPPAKPVPYATKGVTQKTTASGVKYWVTKSSKGAQVKKGQTVKVNYTGYFEDGKIFDSSIPRGEPIEFPIGIGKVIPGWDEAIPLLRVGEKARIFIPSAMGYGPQGSPGAIPPNSNLIFDVEVLGAK